MTEEIKIRRCNNCIKCDVCLILKFARNNQYPLHFLFNTPDCIYEKIEIIATICTKYQERAK